MSKQQLPPFSLYENEIPIETLRAELMAADCGAFVTFEGRVRNHFGGRAVQSLDYSAYAELANEEGILLVQELQQQFGVRAFAAHRVGQLQLGELAVWVGVAAAHRDAAFAGCRAIIDAIKLRVPIWKREHYVEGSARWRHEIEAEKT